MSCKNPDHYQNMLIYGKCYTCNSVWGLDSEMAKKPMPSDEEINDMYKKVESDNKNYHDAHN